MVVRLDALHEDGQQCVLREALRYPFDRCDVGDRLCRAEVLRRVDQLGVAGADLPCGDLGISISSPLPTRSASLRGWEFDARCTDS
ncbi:hypothetical protein AQI84_39935 [Streptomyces griseorubiginosus]|nr:hypothetical protein AQI84_39935 [Streptomyces griseorubiginosus]